MKIIWHAQLTYLCWWHTRCIKQIQQEGSLVILLNPHHLLGDVLTGTPHTAHSQEDVVVQEVTGQHLFTFITHTNFMSQTEAPTLFEKLIVYHTAHNPKICFYKLCYSVILRWDCSIFLWDSQNLLSHRTVKNTCISLGKVALNMSVCLVPVAGMLSFSTMRRIWGSNPISNIRSASSSTRNLQQWHGFMTILILFHL